MSTLSGENMRHAVIIRLHYQPNDPRFEWRLAFFQTMVLPRLEHQTCQDFEIWIACHPWHVARIEALCPMANVVGLPDFPGVDNWNDAQLQGLPRFDLQTSLDSDDLVDLEYIAAIQDIARTHPGPLAISFQPYKLNLLTLKRYKMWERYGKHQCSMFFTLHLPADAEYRSVLSFNHSYVPQWCPNVLTCPEGYCDMTIHGANFMTGLEPNLGEV